VEGHRSDEQKDQPYEIKLGGRNRSDDWEKDRALMRLLAEAGMTWWVEYVSAGDFEVMRESVLRGPLRID
jgi:hypothetical protein